MLYENHRDHSPVVRPWLSYVHSSPMTQELIPHSSSLNSSEDLHRDLRKYDRNQLLMWRENLMQ